jgi:hypothetical protein
LPFISSYYPNAIARAVGSSKVQAIVTVSVELPVVVIFAPAAIVKVLPFVIDCEDPDEPATVKLVIDPSVPEKLKCTPTPSVFENDPLDTT